MAIVGRDPNKTRNEIAAGEAGQQVQRAQETGLQLGEGVQQRQAQAFHAGDQLRQTRQMHDADLEEQTRSNKMREAIASDEQDIEKADKGLESQGPSRADQLRQEMERGRLQAQMDKPLEIASPDRRAVAQTPERQANDKSQRAANELNARARFQDSIRRLQTARATGNDKDAQEAGKNAEQYIESASRLLNNFKTAKAGDNDWSDVERLATKFGEAHPDPALQQEISSRTFGPRMNEFLRANIDQWSLRYIAGTGDMPDGKLVDLASPMMGMLTASADRVQAYLRQADEMTGGAFSQGMKIGSLAERNRIVRKMAAEQLLIAGAQQQASPASSMPIPSQGGPSARPQPSGDAIPNPGGGPPLLRSSEDIRRSAERGRAAGAPAAPAGRDPAEERRRRVEAYGLGGGGKR